MTRTPHAERPHIIKRYCTCEYVSAAVADGEYPVVELDGQLWRRAKTHADCKLHGTNPAHDLPDTI